MSGKRKRSNQPTLSEARAKAPKIDQSLNRICDEHNKLSLRLKNQITKEKFRDIKQMFNGHVGRRELDEMGDFCEFFTCLHDHNIIKLGEYKKLRTALHTVGLRRLNEDIKKTSATIQKLHTKRRNTGSNLNNKRSEIRVKREWNTVRRKWSRIATELYKRSRIKPLKKNFNEMTEFFHGMHTVMERKDLDVKLEIRSCATGSIKETLDRHFTETALTDVRALKRATRVFVERYDAMLVKAARGCLRLTLRFTTRTALEMMWNDYLSGELSNMLTDTIVTIPMKEMAVWEDIFVSAKIDKGQYLNVCRFLPSGINFFERMICKDADGTKEGDDNIPFDSGTCYIPSHEEQHFGPDQKKTHTETILRVERLRSDIPVDDADHKSDNNEEMKSSLQNTETKCRKEELCRIFEKLQSVEDTLQVDFLIEGLLFCNPGGDLEHEFDANEKVQSFEQFIAAHAAEIAKYATGFDKTPICENSDNFFGFMVPGATSAVRSSLIHLLSDEAPPPSMNCHHSI